MEPTPCDPALENPSALPDPSFHMAVVHFYRAEMTRMTVWRMRLDKTSNWAILLTTGMTTFTLGAVSVPHYTLLLGLAFLVPMVYGSILAGVFGKHAWIASFLSAPLSAVVLVGGVSMEDWSYGLLGWGVLLPIAARTSYDHRAGLAISAYTIGSLGVVTTFIAGLFAIFDRSPRLELRGEAWSGAPRPPAKDVSPPPSSDGAASP